MIGTMITPAQAWQELAEGNARRIENAYVGSLPRDEQQQATSEEQQLVAQHPEIFTLPPEGK